MTIALRPFRSSVVHNVVANRGEGWHGHRVADHRSGRHQPPGAGQAAPLDALLADGLLRPRPRDPDHRPRRGLLRLRRARQPLPRRALGAVLRQRRPRPHRVRRGGGPPGRGARLLHAVELRAPAGDRAGGADRLARPGRPQPRLLHLGRLGGGRVGAQARPQLPPRARQRPEAQGDRARDRLPRHLARRPLGHRHHRAALAVRAAGAGRLPRPQHQHLPLAGGPPPALGGGRDRGADRVRGAGDGRRGDPRAGAERGRLLRPARRLLPAGARDLRPPRRADDLRRGDLRLGPARPLVRLRTLRLRRPTSSRSPRR